VTTYAAEEIIAALQDDLERMSFTQDYLYSDEERAEMSARLDDIRTTSSLITHAPDLLESLETAFRILHGISDRLHYEDGEPVTALETRDIEEIYADAVSVLADMEALIIKASPISSGPT
jgi:hypothetical protein